jgi:hypothetical protein
MRLLLDYNELGLSILASDNLKAIRPIQGLISMALDKILRNFYNKELNDSQYYVVRMESHPFSGSIILLLSYDDPYWNPGKYTDAYCQNEYRGMKLKFPCANYIEEIFNVYCPVHMYVSVEVYEKDFITKMKIKIGLRYLRFLEFLKCFGFKIQKS